MWMVKGIKSRYASRNTILHILVIKIIVKTEKIKDAMSILNPMQNPYYNTERLKNVNLIEKITSHILSFWFIHYNL